MSDPRDPIYLSPRSRRSFWQEYRVYPDRFELECWFTLHARHSRGSDSGNRCAASSGCRRSIRGIGFARSFPLKMDCADIRRHVAIKRKSGFMKNLRFTPDDPNKFVETCKTIMKKD